MKRTTGYYATHRSPGGATNRHRIGPASSTRGRRFVAQSHAVGLRSSSMSAWIGIGAILVTCFVLGHVWVQRR